MGDGMWAGWEWHSSARCWNVKQNSKRLPSLTEQYCLSGLSLLSATIVSTVSIWQTDKNFFPQVKSKRWSLAAHEQGTQSLTVQMEEVHTTGPTTSLISVRHYILKHRNVTSEPCFVTRDLLVLGDVSWLQIWRVFSVFVITFTTESHYSANITIKLKLTWSNWLIDRVFSAVFFYAFFYFLCFSRGRQIFCCCLATIRHNRKLNQSSRLSPKFTSIFLITHNPGFHFWVFFPLGCYLYVGVLTFDLFPVVPAYLQNIQKEKRFTSQKQVSTKRKADDCVFFYSMGYLKTAVVTPADITYSPFTWEFVISPKPPTCRLLQECMC